MLLINFLFMNQPAIYYPLNQQKIVIDKETGCSFWSISGKTLQFTRFEVSPGTTFKKHRHDSEQITYVLEGELFFKIENDVFKLSGGDSIVIPDNTEHAVWTESSAAKAVDAWSPINKKYSSI